MPNPLKRILSFLLGIALTLDGLWLLLQKKIHLGTLLPLAIGIGLLFYTIFFTSLQSWSQKTKIRRYLWTTLWTGFFLWVLSVIIFFAFIQYSNSIPSNITQAPAKAILVLGSGIENGYPSPTLKRRLDTAANYAAHNPNALIIMTGGLGFKEQFTEAKIMAQYITSHHPHLKNPIELEDQSTSTALNLLNSQKILKHHEIKLSDPIAIATSDFHGIRARAIAKHQGYKQIISLSATTPLNLRYNAWLREYFAFMSGWILNEY